MSCLAPPSLITYASYAHASKQQSERLDGDETDERPKTKEETPKAPPPPKKDQKGGVGC